MNLEVSFDFDNAFIAVNVIIIKTTRQFCWYTSLTSKAPVSLI